MLFWLIQIKDTRDIDYVTFVIWGPISMSSHTRTSGSFLIICDVNGIKPFAGSIFCLGRCSQQSGYLNYAHYGLQNAFGTLIFVDVLPVIKQ